MSQLILASWHPDVSNGHCYLAFDRNTCSILGHPNDIENKHQHVQGWFAFYEDHPFIVVAVDEDSRSSKFVIGSPPRCFELNADTELRWSSGMGGRLLTATDGKQSEFHFSYRSPWRYLTRPFVLVRDIILGSDWWGLECDLPSFVHSTYRSLDGLGNALERWNERVTHTTEGIDGDGHPIP